MSIPLQQAAFAVVQALLAESLPLNCYWYGYVKVGVGGSYGVQFDGPPIPPGYRPPGQLLTPPYNFGWQGAPAGSPLVGTFGPDDICIAYTDCSGFVAWVLGNQSPAAYGAILSLVWKLRDDPSSDLGSYLNQIDPQHTGPYPSAADYAVLGLGSGQLTESLQALGGNAPNIACALDIAGLLPGDILAWGLAPQYKDTGHVMLIYNPPSQNPDGTWTVDVVDASDIPHANDTRPGLPPPGPPATGVGQGQITLKWCPKDCVWKVNFDVDNPHYQFNPVPYISALRVTADTHF